MQYSLTSLTKMNLKLLLLLTFICYLVISIPILEFIYELSHFYCVKIKEQLADQVPKQYYIETWKVIETFHELNSDGRGTPSEIQNRILNSITMVAFIIKNVCLSWKDPNLDQYKSCDFSIACDLHSLFEKMLLNKTATKPYLSEVQDIFDSHFNYWNVFVIAEKVDQEVIFESSSYFKALKAKYQEGVFENLPIGESESDLSKDVKNIFNLFLDFNEAYFDCLHQFPKLKEHKMTISYVFEGANKKKRLVKVKDNQNSEGFKMAGSLIRNFNYLYLYLCLNHHVMIYINSFVAMSSTIWWLQFGIVLIYCIFSIIPFGITLTLEVFWHYIYRKVFGCDCRIKKKLEILEILASTRPPLIKPKVPKFDNMRKYNRRRRKIASNK